MKTYSCPTCEIEQNDVLVSGYLIKKKEAAEGADYLCPNCGCYLDLRLLEEAGVLSDDL